jgi:hypothetical protein
MLLRPRAAGQAHESLSLALASAPASSVLDAVAESTRCVVSTGRVKEKLHPTTSVPL